MRTLNWLALLVAALISAGEISRFWGTPRFFPMAFDELLVAAALIWATWRALRDGVRAGASWHLVAWSGFCGLVLVLLVETADHQIHGPVKAAGPVYLAALSTMLALGLWAVRRAMGLLAGRGRG